MYVNTLQRYKKTSNRIRKTQKEIYEEGMKQQFKDKPYVKTLKTKPVKSFDKEFDKFLR